MFSSISKRLTYSNVAATLALVFAMSGGAYAAGKYLVTSTKQISPKVLKALKGANGATGAQGPAGAVGPAGPAGAVGGAGKEGMAGKGEKGEKGETGAPGKNGTNGKDGSPWTAGGTLPPKETETGTWTLGEILTKEITSVRIPISFPIRLAAPLAESQAHFLQEKAGKLLEEPGNKPPSAECPGTLEEPQAKPGNLCVYGSLEETAEFEEFGVPGNASGKGTGPTGSSMNLHINESEKTTAGYGTWAVAAPEES
jgi:hypothetical protein